MHFQLLLTETYVMTLTGLEGSLLLGEDKRGIFGQP